MVTLLRDHAADNGFWLKVSTPAHRGNALLLQMAVLGFHRTPDLLHDAELCKLA
ncbi:MAG: hypothetical protein AB8B47_03985 [Roseobacter sp.]